jgi:hypothetical protein
MALFDKLGSLMDNVADKTQVLAETSKLNSRINEENNRISALKLSISNHILGLFDKGEIEDEQLTSLCEQVKSSLGIIAELQAEIARLKG